MKIPIKSILPNPDQPRTVFDQAELDQLASSIREVGLLNPIAVEGPHGDEIYILLDGERRLRAMKQLGRTSIEANVRRPTSDGQERLLMAMIGNLQRSDMGPIDEALAFRRLREKLTTEEIAQRVGRSTAHVYFRIRMLEFPESVQELFNSRKLPLDEGSIGALRKLTDEQMIQVANAAVGRELSARQIQSMAARIKRAGGINVKPVKAPRMIHSDSTCPALDFNPGLSKSWSWVRGAAKKTCEQCGLYEGGGKNTICKECPLTIFIGRIVAGYKAGNEEGAE
ncbi:MAG TPA: ParB/RepB/Spo0J family partition protein [Bellilinea sp.]|nr:ParB/RepB/Spo0J family partition protein [Bellilinea sp.]